MAPKLSERMKVCLEALNDQSVPFTDDELTRLIEQAGRVKVAAQQRDVPLAEALVRACEAIVREARSR